MKRILIAVSFATITSASLAAPQPQYSGGADFDRSQPTYPELGKLDSLQLASDQYRIDAGDSAEKALVQDYGSV
jgi:hypothetical protein